MESNPSPSGGQFQEDRPSPSEELWCTQEALQREIAERRRIEETLHLRETELEIKNRHLHETNIALNMLLKRRELDRGELEEQVQYNVQKTILPYIDELRRQLIAEDRRALLAILEASLNDITGSFSRRLSIDYYGLTGMELKVANLIRQGKRSLEIAQVMRISPRTVESHRQAIRRKLRLKNKKINLRTFLLSIS